MTPIQAGPARPVDAQPNNKHSEWASYMCRQQMPTVSDVEKPVTDEESYDLIRNIEHQTIVDKEQWKGRDGTAGQKAIRVSANEEAARLRMDPSLNKAVRISLG
jgi:hypothetical protein